VVGFQKARQSADFVHCLLGIMPLPASPSLLFFFSFLQFMSFSYLY